MIMADHAKLFARIIAGIDPAVGARSRRASGGEAAGYEVPPEAALRNRLREAAKAHISKSALTPPLTLDALMENAEAVLRAAGAQDRWLNFAAVLVSNAVWRDTVAAVPYSRRLLLLPQCLRSREKCRGQIDEFGLLCAACGSCRIESLQAEAEELGYVVLVAEGTTVVTKLLEEGRIDAVVGVSCLSVLERAFAPMSENAIPGIAVPLLADGCEGTQVDVDWVREAISLYSPGGPNGMTDLDGLKEEVASWFERANLESVIEADGKTTEVALSWLAQAGKRWRPFLAASAARALGGPDADEDVLRSVAVAVECFHKASLVHDDIEDGDSSRYGQPSLHARYGLAVALNAGDLLIGEGYRLIAESGAAPARISEMLSVAAEGHRTLCLGQGAELNWTRGARSVSVREVIEVFRRKTAPAFEVALRLGAIAAGAGDDVQKALAEFSGALGIAYQVKDDIEDFESDSDGAAKRPWLLFAIAHEQCEGEAKKELESAWHEGSLEEAQRIIAETGAPQTAARLRERCRSEAIAALAPLGNVALKSLLQRAVGRILGPSTTE